MNRTDKSMLFITLYVVVLFLATAVFVLFHLPLSHTPVKYHTYRNDAELFQQLLVGEQ